MKTGMVLRQKYGKFKTGEVVDVDDSDVESLVADGIARVAREADYDNQDNSEEVAKISDDVAEQVKRELRAEMGFEHKIPAQPGANYASEGWGPISPKKFWMTESPSGNKFSSAADFLNAVVGASEGQWDSRLKDLSSTIGAEGGYLIPCEMANFIWMEIIEDSPFFTQATLLPMESNSISVPFVHDEDRSGEKGIHGVEQQQPSESAALLDISPTFGLCTLRLSKCGGRARVPNELLEDSKQAMGVLLPGIFADSLTSQMQRLFLTGSGAGEPQGILNAPAMISITKESSQPATTLTYANIVNMWSRMLPKARKTAVWMANIDAEPQLRMMSITVGTGGSSVFVMNAATGLPQSIFGRPLYFTEYLPTLGAEGDIVCFNPRAYAIGRKLGGALRIESSEHIRFENDQTVFRALTRIDGQALQSGPITPQSGSANTLSNFVMLGVRD